MSNPFPPTLTKGLALSRECYLLQIKPNFTKGADYVKKKDELGKAYLFLCQLKSIGVNSLIKGSLITMKEWVTLAMSCGGDSTLLRPL